MNEWDANKILITWKEIIDKHVNRIYSAGMQWEKLEVRTPFSPEPVDQVLPIFLIDFKY